MSSELFTKDNKPRGKWARKIKPPKKYSPLIEFSLFQKIQFLLMHPKKIFVAGLESVLREKTPVITDLVYQNRMSTELGEYLDWYFSSKGFLHSIDWMGIPTRKIPMDMWVYQEIIVETKPDFIIEIGAFYGGSTLFLAQVCEGLGKGKVISIDISHDFFMATHPRIEKITGDCSNSHIISKVKEMVQHGTVMVIHDGDHNAAAVKRDLDLYAPLVSPGMYLIVEDGVVDLFNPSCCKLGKTYPNGGPLKASREFLSTSSEEFELDMRRERFILTTNPEGYLRRKTDNK